jgi:hypothetical protein
MSRYQWVHHNGAQLYEVGILLDGTLHNPRGYPDDIVRAAVLAADQRRHEPTAVTRARRQDKKIYDVAQRLTVQAKKSARGMPASSAAEA